MNLSLRYAAPLLGLSALIAVFFLRRRFITLRPVPGLVVRLVAAAPLVLSGVAHVVHPELFVTILPPPLPQQNWLIVVTGLPELLGAIGLFVPGTRRLASLCLAVFMVAIFPANIYAAGRVVHGLAMPAVPVRTTMQAAYIVLLLVAGWGLPARRLPR